MPTLNKIYFTLLFIVICIDQLPASVAFVKGQVLTTIGKVDIVLAQKNTDKYKINTSFLMNAAIF